MLLMLFSLLVISSALNSEKIVEPPSDVPEEPSNGFCPRILPFDEFRFIYSRTCPIDMPFGFNELVFDPSGEIRYRCQDVVPPELEENTVHLVNSSTLLSMINNPYKDKYRRSWCMISLLYNPNCVFSSRLAPAFNAIPKNYENIRAVALDATHFSRLNTRYGISGTPTLILWVKGVPVARMEDRELDVRGIADFLSEWTDLESFRISTGEDGPLVIEPSGHGDLLLTLASICVLLLGLIYKARERLLALPVVDTLLQKMGTSSGQVNIFLNGM